VTLGESTRDAGSLADARLALARVLWRSRIDRKAAEDLAKNARDGLASAGPLYRRELAEADAWLKDRRRR
jgi:hypothetical protein